MSDGVRSADLPAGVSVDSLIGNNGDGTVTINIGRLAALLNGYIGPAYQTRAQLFADLAWPSKSLAQVYGDSTAAYIGTYQKSGNSGSGSWTRIGDLPASAVGAAQIAAEEAARSSADTGLRGALRDGAIVALTSIAGTADAITADLSAATLAAGITDLGTSTAIELWPLAANTIVNPTLTVAGRTYGIRNPDGGGWPAGAFVPGRAYLLRRASNTTLRVIAGDLTRQDFDAAIETVNQTARKNTDGINTVQVGLGQIMSGFGETKNAHGMMTKNISTLTGAPSGFTTNSLPSGAELFNASAVQGFIYFGGFEAYCAAPVSVRITSWRFDGSKWVAVEFRDLSMVAGYNNVRFGAPMMLGHGQMWSIRQTGTGLYFSASSSYDAQGNGEGWYLHTGGDFTKIPNNMRGDGTRIAADLRTGTGLWRINGGYYQGVGGSQKAVRADSDLFWFDFPFTGAMNYLPASALTTDPAELTPGALMMNLSSFARYEDLFKSGAAGTRGMGVDGYAVQAFAKLVRDRLGVKLQDFGRKFYFANTVATNIGGAPSNTADPINAAAPSIAWLRQGGQNRRIMTVHNLNFAERSSHSTTSKTVVKGYIDNYIAAIRDAKARISAPYPTDDDMTLTSRVMFSQFTNFAEFREHVPQAYMECYDENRDIAAFVNPTYTYFYTEDRNITPAGAKRYAAGLAATMWSILFEERPREALRMTGCYSKGATIYIKTNAQHRLVIDTDYIPQVSGFGFLVGNPGGTIVVPDAITVTDENELALLMPDGVTPGTRIRYGARFVPNSGATGATFGGNIREEDPAALHLSSTAHSQRWLAVEDLILNDVEFDQVVMSQAEYEGLPTRVPNTFYYLTE